MTTFFHSFNIATQGTQHSHDARQRDQFRVNRSSINLADNRIRIFLPTLVNSTPLDIIHKMVTHSIQGFLSHIKRYLINRYRDNCYVCKYSFWCFIVIILLAPFGGALMILNTFIGTKSVNWGAKCWKISRGVSLGLQLATTFKVYSDCIINIYVTCCYFVSFTFVPLKHGLRNEIMISMILLHWTLLVSVTTLTDISRHTPVTKQNAL